MRNGKNIFAKQFSNKKVKGIKGIRLKIIQKGDLKKVFSNKIKYKID